MIVDYQTTTTHTWPFSPNPQHHPAPQVLAPSYAAAAHQIGEAMRLAYSHKRPVDRAAEEVELAMIHGGYSIQHSLARATLREAKHTEHPVTPPDVEVVAVAEGGKEGDVYDESGELREEL